MSTWTEAFFDGLWHDVQRARYTPESAERIAAGIVDVLALDAGDRLLDVPCGAGPLAVPLAARGIQVTGVDSSETMLTEARAAAGARGVTLDLHHTDMRELPWEDGFDAVLNYWGSFGYFDDAGNEAFAGAVFRALKPGGRFLIEGPSTELLMRRLLEPVSEAEAGGVQIREVRRYDFLEGVAHVDWTFVRGDERMERRSSIRMYSVAELVSMLRRVGFSAFEVYAALDRRPFELGARMNLVATR